MEEVNTIVKGEQSALRNYSFTSLDKAFKDAYTINTAKIDYSLCRELFLNSHENYKLGAGFCKPIINALVSFMGIPTWLTDDEQAKEVISKYLEDKEELYVNIQRNYLREGDCYVLLTNEKINNILFKNELIIDFKILLPERITEIKNEYGDIKEIIIRTTIKYKDRDNNNISYEVVESWTNETYLKNYNIKSIPNGFDESLTNISKENPYGFIPIIKFTNDKEQFRETGTSELEPVEPFIRAYHDIMLDHLRSNKLNSSPKLLIKTEDIQNFLNNNFTETEIQQKQLKLAKKDILLCGADEDMKYIEVTANNYSDLLEFLFMCIVDVSETPEFLFGTAVPSSRASVREQMTPINKKVKRKRSQVKDPYQLMARMVFAVWNANNLLTERVITDFKTKIIWDDVDSEDDNLKAITINTIVTALMNAVETKLMSYESAINFLAQYVNTMEKYDEEKEKILLQIDEMDNDIINDLTEQLDLLKNESNNNNNNNNNNSLNDGNDDPLNDGNDD